MIAWLRVCGCVCVLSVYLCVGAQMSVCLFFRFVRSFLCELVWLCVFGLVAVRFGWLNVCVCVRVCVSVCVCVRLCVSVRLFGRMLTCASVVLCVCLCCCSVVD